MTSFKPGDRVMYTGSASKIKGKIGYAQIVTRYGAYVDFGNDQSGIVALSNLRPAWQVCKDCNGHGELMPDIEPEHASAPCPTCSGTGRINRTGPYKLQSGEWSDGLSRDEPMQNRKVNKGRWEVYSDGREWVAEHYSSGMLGNDETFTTHAEAIAYAHKKARESA